MGVKEGDVCKTDTFSKICNFLVLGSCEKHCEAAAILRSEPVRLRTVSEPAGHHFLFKNSFEVGRVTN